MRTETTTRYLRLTPLIQVIVGSATAVFLCWTVIISATFFIDVLSAKSDKSHTQVLKQAYETRLNDLSAERDQRALEAQRAQERFYVALEQISIQQSDLLSAEEERRELATGLKIMQQKLQSAVKERDIAQADADSVRAELIAETGNLNTRLGAAIDVENTLAFVSEALQSTAIQRDSLAQSTHNIAQSLSDMQFETELKAEENDRIFTSLEEAVSVSLTPLRQSLKRSGVNTDALLNEIRRRYSGTGGPLTPLTISSSSGGTTPDAARANKLLKEFEQINLMKLAARNLPLAIPVQGSFRYTSGFGPRRDPKGAGRRMHNGRDMAGSLGTPIVAPGDGVVIFAGRQSGYGNVVKIRHAQGIETVFAHLSRIYVKKGQKVSRLQKIGGMGSTGRSTGVHLHYEIRIAGKPINPSIFMKAANDVF